MASKGEGSEPLHYKTWVLKVSIHCEGCKRKVRKILQNVSGVYTIEIDSQQNKVTVTGNVEAETLIRKLLKSGKQAELWPVEMKKPNNPNPNPNNTSKDKGEEKQKDASVPDAPTEKKTEKPPEKSSPATKPETATKPAETAAPAEKVAPATKPAETDSKPAAARAEVSESTTNKEASKPKPNPNPEKAPASPGPEAKPIEAITKGSGSGSGKRKGKKVAEAAGNQEFLMNSGGAPTVHQVPGMYPQPVYAASYNMAHPTASYSYYTPMPQPPMPQSYLYSGHPPPPPEYHPHYLQYPTENYYSQPPENYYGSMEPPASQSQGSYDFFSDENANSCTVM